MKELDEQERQIIHALIRNPRYSDNRVSTVTGVPVRTVSRKRLRLEQEGILSYQTVDDLQANGTGRFTAMHMLVIKFRLGITRSQIVQEIRSEPNVVSVFYELIRYSFIAETDGHIALVMIVEGMSASDIAENVQGKIIPSLQKNHGVDSIVELRTIRLLDPIRREHNYLPLVNMEQGFIKKDWPEEAIFAE